MKKLIKSPDELNDAIHNEVVNSLEGKRIEGKSKTLVFHDVKADKIDNSFGRVADASKKGGSVTRKYHATATVLDKDGNKIDSKRIYIGDIPIATKKGGFFVDGSTYVIPHQIRLKPSAYTQVKNNGDIETMFNPDGTHNFKIVSPRDKDDIRVRVGTQGFNPYDMAKILGASDSAIERKLGKGMMDKLKLKSNIKETAQKMARKLGLIGPDITPSYEDVSDMIRKHFEKGRIDPDATKMTLGHSHDKIDANTVLNALKKNIDVKRGAVAPDDKENLVFKKIMTPEALIGEGINREMRKHDYKIKSQLDNPFKNHSVAELVGKPPLKDAAKSFIVTSAISRRPEEYNPLQTLQVSSDITPLGEGGISSQEMVTPEVRSLHMSQLGFIDPIKSPEGANTGVTLSLTHGAHVDDKGNAAIEVKNLKTGKKEIRTIKDLWNKKVAFPDVDKKGEVGIRIGDTIVKGKVKNADYQIAHAQDMYGPAMNALGIISANDPTRNLMASKHVTQALPIVDADANPVSLQSKNGDSMLRELAKRHLPLSPVSGTVKKVDAKKGVISVQGSDGKLHNVDYANSPIQLNTKTAFEHRPVVKPGDKVKAGQHLADSTFTKDGELAIGKNIRTAWLMYPGTRNDAFVVSETGAKKLSSVHSEKFDIDESNGTIFDKRKFASMFPEVAKKIDMNKYDERGFAKEGVKLTKDEPIYLGLRKMDPSEARFANDKIKKLMYGGFIPVIERWKSENTATVRSIGKKGNSYRVTADYHAPLKVGDKIAGRSGNKGIISAVVPDKEMPHDEEGKPVELIMGGAGVISRQNPAQIIESALTEVSKKTGKKYVLPHYTDESMVDFAINEAKKHGVKLYHKLYDPVRKTTLKSPVYVANYNIMKLFKQGEGAYSAVGHGGTDMYDQPLKGGKESAASISNMEINSLLAHDARAFLREAGDIRSQKNKEWFAKFEAGETPPAPEVKSARKHFGALLSQININLKEDGRRKQLIPMTDSDVLKKSSGKVTEPFGLKRNTLTPVEGGFYDQKIFGKDGNMYGHIDIRVPVINPLYKTEVSRLLGVSSDKLDKMIQEQGSNAIMDEVSKIKPKDKIRELKDSIRKTKDSAKIDRAMKSIKLLKKVDSLGKTLPEVAFMTKIPVLPTQFRLPGKLPNGAITEHDVNHHYAELIRASNTYEEGQNAGVPQEDLNVLNRDIQHHTEALFGTRESPSKRLKKSGVKGIMDIVGGDNPKHSFWHQKILKNKVFTSGRAVIVPHTKDLSMDQVELPKNVAWKVFEPHVKRKMAQMGMAKHEIDNHIEKRTDTAHNVLLDTMKQVPVVVNRAPSLHKHNMTGHYAKLSPGNVMHIPPEIESGHNADYDGDQLAIHVPLTEKAIHDVKTKLMASKQLFAEDKRGKLMMGIDLDPFIGFYDATKDNKGKK